MLESSLFLTKVSLCSGRLPFHVGPMIGQHLSLLAKGAPHTEAVAMSDVSCLIAEDHSVRAGRDLTTGCQKFFKLQHLVFK